MALYLGVSNDGTFVSSEGYKLQSSDDLLLSAIPVSNKQKIIINNVVYRLNIELTAKESE